MMRLISFISIIAVLTSSIIGKVPTKEEFDNAVGELLQTLQDLAENKPEADEKSKFCIDLQNDSSVLAGTFVNARLHRLDQKLIKIYGDCPYLSANVINETIDILQKIYGRDELRVRQFYALSKLSEAIKNKELIPREQIEFFGKLASQSLQSDEE